jgi:hypothetical protein
LRGEPVDVDLDIGIDDPGRDVDLVTEALRNYELAVEVAAGRAIALREDFDSIGVRAEILRGLMEGLLDRGVKPATEGFSLLQDEMDRLNRILGGDTAANIAGFIDGIDEIPRAADDASSGMARLLELEGEVAVITGTATSALDLLVLELEAFSRQGGVAAIIATRLLLALAPQIVTDPLLANVAATKEWIEAQRALGRITKDEAIKQLLALRDTLEAIEVDFERQPARAQAVADGILGIGAAIDALTATASTGKGFSETLIGLQEMIEGLSITETRFDAARRSVREFIEAFDVQEFGIIGLLFRGIQIGETADSRTKLEDFAKTIANLGRDAPDQFGAAEASLQALVDAIPEGALPGLRGLIDQIFNFIDVRRTEGMTESLNDLREELLGLNDDSTKFDGARDKVADFLNTVEVTEENVLFLLEAVKELYRIVDGEEVADAETKLKAFGASIVNLGRDAPNEFDQTRASIQALVDEIPEGAIPGVQDLIDQLFNLVDVRQTEAMGQSLVDLEKEFSQIGVRASSFDIAREKLTSFLNVVTLAGGDMDPLIIRIARLFGVIADAQLQDSTKQLTDFRDSIANLGRDAPTQFAQARDGLAQVVALIPEGDQVALAPLIADVENLIDVLEAEDAIAGLDKLSVEFSRLGQSVSIFDQAREKLTNFLDTAVITEENFEFFLQRSTELLDGLDASELEDARGVIEDFGKTVFDLGRDTPSQFDQMRAGLEKLVAAIPDLAKAELAPLVEQIANLIDIRETEAMSVALTKLETDMSNLGQTTTIFDAARTRVNNWLDSLIASGKATEELTQRALTLFKIIGKAEFDDSQDALTKFGETINDIGRDAPDQFERAEQGLQDIIDLIPGGQLPGLQVFIEQLFGMIDVRRTEIARESLAELGEEFENLGLKTSVFDTARQKLTDFLNDLVLTEENFQEFFDEGVRLGGIIDAAEALDIVTRSQDALNAAVGQAPDPLLKFRDGLLLVAEGMTEQADAAKILLEELDRLVGQNAIVANVKATQEWIAVQRELGNITRDEAIAQLENLRGVLQELEVDFRANPVLALAIAAGILGITKAIDGLTEPLVSLGDRFRAAAGTLSAGSAEIVTGFGSIADAFGAITDIEKEAGGVDFISRITTGLQGLSGVISGIRNGNILDTISGLASGLGELIGGLVPGIGPGLGQVIGAGFGLVENIVGGIRDAFSGQSDASRAISEGIAGAVTGGLTEALNAFRKGDIDRTELRAALEESVSEAIFNATISQLIEGTLIVGALKPILDEISVAILAGNTSLVSALIAQIPAVLNSILPGIINAADQLGRALDASLPGAPNIPLSDGGVFDRSRSLSVPPAVSGRNANASIASLERSVAGLERSVNALTTRGVKSTVDLSVKQAGFANTIRTTS